MVVTLLSDRTERLASGSVLFRDDGFELVVTRSRPHQHRFIVAFDQIKGREQADDFRGTLLYGDPIDDPDALWVHELIGSAVVDIEDTALGRVESILENPASDLLVLEDEGLIPLTFFVEQRADGTIVVDPPVGLLDDEEEE